MEIMPNSTIKFLRNIPFDNDYNDTIYFENPQQQANYFSGDEFVKYTLTEQMYTRHSETKINVRIPFENPTRTQETFESSAESLFDCNYMMFKNNSFKYKDPDDGFYKSKWFYAFITEVEYVNNELARVSYEIDCMQSWMFDYILEQCFIEREHSKTDLEGENTIEEKLQMGDSYMTTSVVNKIALPEKLNVIVLYARDVLGQYPPIRLVNNIPTSLGVRKFNLVNDLDSLTTFLEDYLSSTSTVVSADDIVSMYIFPDITLTGTIQNNEIVHIDKSVGFPYLNTINKSLSSYHPVNKKLYTYPYCGIEVSNHEGTSELYKFEYFKEVPSSLSPVPYRYSFRIVAAEAPSPALAIYPINYLPSQSPATPYYPNVLPVIGEDYKNDGYDYGISISDFQQCAWVGDAFKAWWAQNKNSFVTSTVAGVGSGIAQLVAGGMTHNPYLIGTGIVGVGSSVGGAVAKVEDIKHKTPSISGLSNSISLPIATDYFGFTLRAKAICGEYAEIIDNYFSMFGYATNLVKTPNIHVREKWTYTQTIGCTIKGRLPASYQEKICKIFDKGIRFWDRTANVGEYRNPSTGELYRNRCLAEITQ